ncbi:RrF2 family transcriptional regulator [Candidatus Omnitrophota bacterium]
MKLITRDTDYAIRALSCIAASEGGMITVSHLSDELYIPRPFLRKIFQILNKAGLLKSFKGKGGGFSLVEKPGKITIFDLVEIFQGPFRLSDHTFKGATCPHIELCYLRKKLDNIEKDIAKELKSITIASLVKNGCDYGETKNN